MQVKWKGRGMQHLLPRVDHTYAMMVRQDTDELARVRSTCVLYLLCHLGLSLQ